LFLPRQPSNFASMNLLLRILILTVSLGITGCGVMQKTRTIAIATTNRDDSAPCILLTNFDMVSPDSIVQLNSMLNRGVLRERQTNDYKVDDLQVEYLNTNGHPLKTLFINNPLRKLVEYSDDYQNLQLKEVNLPSASFSVRAQYSIAMKLIRVSRITNINPFQSKRITETAINIESHEEIGN